MVVEIFGGAVGLYRIVPPNEAHVRVMSGKKQVFMCRSKTRDSPDKDLEPDDPTLKSAYWVTPFVTKITRLPLVNLRIDVPDVKLNDKDMAKFMCDVVCFVNIDNPLLAAERTEITTSSKGYQGMDITSEDFKAIMESIMRTVATKSSILDIYKDRAALDNAITKEVEVVFPRWGLRLVDLEIKDIKDVQGSTIIQDIEKKIAATISADARVKIAQETKRAEIEEAMQKKDAELVKAQTEEEWRKRQIEKDRQIGVSQQDQLKMVAEKEKEANVSKIEARRKMEVGGAEVEKEAMVQRAEGQKQKVSLEAEGEARSIDVKGTATADVTKKTLVAQADGTEKLALAQQKYNDAATTIEWIKANKDVGLAYATAYTKVFEKATVNVVAGSTQELLHGGLPGNVSIGPKEGVALSQMITAAGPDGVKAFIEAAKAFTAKKPEAKKEGA